MLLSLSLHELCREIQILNTVYPALSRKKTAKECFAKILFRGRFENEMTAKEQGELYVECKLRLKSL